MTRFLLLLLLAPPALADAVTPARLAAALQGLSPDWQVELATLQQLDEGLLRPASLYPALSRYPVATLSRLYAQRQDCARPASGLPQPWARFEAARCGAADLPAAWFAANPVHPLGGSSAWHYLQRHLERAAELAPYLHVRERRDALAPLGRLSDDNLDALVAGSRWLLDGDALWFQDGRRWRRYPAAAWRPVADGLGVDVVRAGEGECVRPAGALCLNPRPQGASWRVLAGAGALVAALALLTLWVQRRRLLRERQFVLQMLTHELRTPIASLANVVEAFRRDFDILPERLYPPFGHLADGVSRLRQLADASRHYLSAGRVLEERRPLPLADWLDAAAERHGVVYCLEQDRVLALPAYWLGVCLDNLLSNARRHGTPPVHLHAAWLDGRLRLAVRDAGVLPRYRLSRLQRAASRADGMGLGLTIVSRVMRRLGGRLSLAGPPTTLILELPCDAIAD